MIKKENIITDLFAKEGSLTANEFFSYIALGLIIIRLLSYLLSLLNQPIISVIGNIALIIISTYILTIIVPKRQILINGNIKKGTIIVIGAGIVKILFNLNILGSRLSVESGSMIYLVAQIILAILLISLCIPETKAAKKSN